PEAMAGEPWARVMLRDRADLLAEDDRVYLGTTAGAGPDATFVDRIPVGVTMEMIERGEERFNIYCSACHGYTGVGDGMVGQKWSYTPANLMIDLYQDRSQRQGKDGYLFHVVREGVWDPATGANRMPGYKHAVDVHDAWAIVAYLRVLQTRGGVPLDDLDPTDRERLLRSAPTTAAGPAEPEPIASAGGEQ
ncbi:MAG: cytochrome c, partial [Planctomycetota bacterium]